jgi:hypothetical protein
MIEQEATGAPCSSSTSGANHDQKPLRVITLAELMATDFSKAPADRRLYGKWTCADGREVLFNRGYKPIWQRCPGQPAEPADPHERVDDIVGEADYYWIDGKGTDTKGRRLLKEWGVG